MTSEQQKQQGFNSSKRTIEQYRHLGSQTMEHHAKRIMRDLAWNDSAFSEGCRMALRVYIGKGA